MPRSSQQQADIRCCASCEWIYRRNGDEHRECPKCGWVSYGARYVHGDRAYRYLRTQEPWLKRKMTETQVALLTEISQDPEVSRIQAKYRYNQGLNRLFSSAKDDI